MRIRSIKPEFWRSDDITALPMDIRLLFIGLWSYVDDNGVGVDDHRQIAADLFALEEDQKETRDFVRDGLATLSRRLLIVRYKVNNKSYLHIRTWKLHQRVDRPGKARFPLPPEDSEPPTSGNTDSSDSSRECRESLDRVSAALDTGSNPTHGHKPNNSPHSGTPALVDPNGLTSDARASDQQVCPPSRHPRDTLATGEGEKGRRGEGEKSKSKSGGDPVGLPAAGGQRAREAGRPAGRTEHPSPAELNGTATRHGGYAAVAAWALDNPGMTTSQQRRLAKAVDELLAQRADPDLIPVALDEAHRPHWRDPVASLPSAYDRVRRDAHPAPPAPVRSAPRESTTARAHAEVDAAFEALGHGPRTDQSHLRALPGGA